MLFTFSARDVANLLGIIFIIAIIASFGEFLASVGAFLAACGLGYLLYRLNLADKKDILQRRELSLRKSENTHEISPAAYCRKVMGEVEARIADELAGTVIEHIGSNIGEQVCEESYQILYTDSIDAPEEDMIRHQVNFTMDAQKAIAAQIEVFDLNIWPVSKALILSFREASVAATAAKIAEAFLANSLQENNLRNPAAPALSDASVNPASVET